MIRFRFLLLGFAFLSACGDDESPPLSNPSPTLEPTAVATVTATLTASLTPTRTSTLTPVPTAADTPPNTSPPTAPPTSTSTATPPPTVPGTPDPPECCGDGLVDASVECEDGNQVGGDGCAANCTGERLLEASTRLTASVQGVLFAIPLATDTVHRLVIGRPTMPGGVASCLGGPSFEAGEIPAVERAGASEYPPISVPGLVCACVRTEDVSRCGKSAIRPDPPDCSLGPLCDTEDDCGDGEACVSTHGLGNSLSGIVGCAGLRDVDYLISVDLGESTCTRSGGPAPPGSALLHSTLRIGTITGNCLIDEGDPNKGADGIPCTDDDPVTVRGGAPGTSLLTTGTATASVRTGDVIIEPGQTCGAEACIASVTGSPFSCDALVLEPPGTGTVKLCSVIAALGQPQVGDTVLAACIEPREP